MPHRPHLPQELAEPQVEESHPIHDTSKIDVVVQTDRGAAYGLVIAAPVTGSLSTQTRLLDKIEAYIGDFYSPSFLSKYGEPTTEYCKITVAIHPASDPVIFKLLKSAACGLEVTIFASQFKQIFANRWCINDRLLTIGSSDRGVEASLSQGEGR